MSAGREKRAFSLLEMLLALAVLAIVAAIAIPALSAAVRRARAAADLSAIRGGYVQVLAMAELGDVWDGQVFLLQADGTVEDITKQSGDPYRTRGSSPDAAGAGGIALPPWTAGSYITYTLWLGQPDQIQIKALARPPNLNPDQI